jgi:hypothetical protein
MGHFVMGRFVMGRFVCESMRTPGMYSFLCKSTENSNKKFFSQVTF